VAFNEEGTVAYKAPEVLAKENPASKASDVWALGIILYIMMCGAPPFSKPNDHPDLPSDIIACRYHFSHRLWEHVEDTPVGAIDLIKKMLCRDPAERITVAGILVHPFITNRQATVPFESKYFKRLRSVGFARYGASLWAVVYVARWLRRTRALLKARKSESDAFVGATCAAASSSSCDYSSLRRSKRCRMK
jgi:serine/threonine protein kinase